MRLRMKQQVSLCVLDLDNTLFDWVGIWHAAFSAKLAVLSRTSGISLEVLLPEFRTVHQRYGTTEYPFAIEELPSLRRQHPTDDLMALYDDAMHAYYKARKQALALYPCVRDTLSALRERGCRLVAYTESLAFYSAYRLRQLDLDRLIEVLYSPQDHQLPRNMRPEDLRRYPAEHYALRGTVHRHTPPGELKPNPDVLNTILRDVGVQHDRAIYVGDSRMKDIAMANVAGVTSVWAAYGAAQHRPEYALLRAVTHWTDDDVAREQSIAEGRGISETDLTPDFVLSNSLCELLDLFDFESHENGDRSTVTGTSS
jgi:FMN phosphatase YigB (HAD superfamily)